jgi:glucan 1,3-beta-glucosidase
VTSGPNLNCRGAFLMVHVTSSASPYIENSHMWAADHELDLADHNQINIYNGRGILIESTKGAWLYGTAAEHSQMYQYGLQNAQNVYMSFIQTEVPYMQNNPDATVPFKFNQKYNDPNFYFCSTSDTTCKKAWGLKMNASSNIYVYGAGLYSFFQNYGQDCIGSNTCSANMVHTQSSSNINLYALSTVGTKNMVTKDGVAQVSGDDNRSNFASTIALWQY